MITPNEARDRYHKMDYEGGFWEFFNHSGSSILDGTPFEEFKGLVAEADEIAMRYSEWLEDQSDFADEEVDEEDDFD